MPTLFTRKPVWLLCLAWGLGPVPATWAGTSGQAGAPAARPDPGRCRMTVTTPALASGLPEHSCTLTLSLRTAGGQPVTGLSSRDFNVQSTDGDSRIDWDRFREEPPGSGIYRLPVSSRVAGRKTLHVAVQGIALDPEVNASSQVMRFDPGVYGRARNAASGSPLAGLELALRRPEGSTAATARTDQQGRFQLLLPSAVPLAPAPAWELSASDPAGNYRQAAFPVVLAPDTAVNRDFSLTFLPPEQDSGRVFPNPAQRGQTVTVEYALREAGPVRVEVFDLRGRRILTLIDAARQAGRYSLNWACDNRFGRALAPGTYLVSLRLGQNSLRRKLVIQP